MPREESAAKPRTSTRDHTELVTRLADWLHAATGADARPRITDVRAPESGGLSSETLLADLEWNVGGQSHRRAVAVRLPPPPDAWPVFPTYDLARQAAAMDWVRAHTDVPVPEILWFEPAAGPVGAPFIVMERRDGVAAPDVMPYTWGSWVTDLSADELAEVARRTVEVLAAVHAAPVEPEIAAALEIAEHPGSPTQRHLAHTRAHFDWVAEGRAFPTIERAFAVLGARLPDEAPAAISWGDARLGNILWSGTTPVAVLDWESAALAPPEVDLGWLVYFGEYFQRTAERAGHPGLPGFLHRESVVPVYEAIRGGPARDLDWYLAYAALRQAIVSIRTTDRAVRFGERPAPDDPEALIMDRGGLADLVDTVAGA